MACVLKTSPFKPNEGYESFIEILESYYQSYQGENHKLFTVRTENGSIQITTEVDKLAFDFNDQVQRDKWDLYDLNEVKEFLYSIDIPEKIKEVILYSVGEEWDFVHIHDLIPLMAIPEQNVEITVTHPEFETSYYTVTT